MWCCACWCSPAFSLLVVLAASHQSVEESIFAPARGLSPGIGVLLQEIDVILGDNEHAELWLMLVRFLSVAHRPLREACPEVDLAPAGLSILARVVCGIHKLEMLLDRRIHQTGWATALLGLLYDFERLLFVHTVAVGNVIVAAALGSIASIAQLVAAEWAGELLTALGTASATELIAALLEIVV